jgi:hypothetical protein
MELFPSARDVFAGAVELSAEAADGTVLQKSSNKKRTNFGKYRREGLDGLKLDLVIFYTLRA